MLQVGGGRPEDRAAGQVAAQHEGDADADQPGHEQGTRPLPDPGLTERELDVVRALARGRTNPGIAADLHVSLSTVKTHLNHVHAKLGVRNRVEVAAWAWEHGVIRSMS